MVEDYSKHSSPLESEALVQNDLNAGEGISSQANLSGRVWHGEINAALDNLKQAETQFRSPATLSAEVSLGCGLSNEVAVNQGERHFSEEPARSDKIDNRLYPSTKDVNFIDCEWGKRLFFSEEMASKAQREDQRRRLVAIDMTPYMWNHSSF